MKKNVVKNEVTDKKETTCDVIKQDFSNCESMRMSRRRFVQMAGAVGAAVALGKMIKFDPFQTAAAFSNSPGLTKFTQPLRGVFPLDANGIPVAVPDGKRPWGRITANHYTIDINEYLDTLHPDLGGSTTLRGYHSRANLGGSVPQRHLGAIIVAQKGVPVQITFQNNLTGAHPLPVDLSIMGAMDGTMAGATNVGQNRVSTHLHGGEVPWFSDGGPFSWFGSSDKNDGSYNKYGASVQSGRQNLYKFINRGLLPGQAEVYYPNNQSARLMWYHDHAVGITRLNAYAGIASAYIIRDTFEKSLVAKGLPDFIENLGYELPIVIQDKIFVSADTFNSGSSAYDGTWATSGAAQGYGSLWYPHEYDPDRWTLDPRSSPYTPPSDPSVVAEMFGDTMLANGFVFPKAEVEPRRYRLRILNACQARFLNLTLYEDNGEGQPDTTKPGPAFLVIGAEGGFLKNPVKVEHSRMNFVDAPDNTTVDPATPGGSLITAPAERWDIIVDFSGKDANSNPFEGRKFILCNDAPAPYPGGDGANTHLGTFNGINPVGPDSGTIMRFDVITPLKLPADSPLGISPTTPLALDPKSGIDQFLVPLNTSVINPVTGNLKNLLSFADKVRNLTLNEVFDEHGRLIQMLGTNQTVPSLPAGFTADPSNPDFPNNYAREYTDPVTENAKDGDVEVWQIANLTADVHPMHFHLVNVQLLARQAMDVDINGVPLYHNGVPDYGTGARHNRARGPLPTELGWKETVKMNPGEVTTVIMKFKLPRVPFDVPPSLRPGINGNEYVWHCHILEHEEHDMMRPLVVKQTD